MATAVIAFECPVYMQIISSAVMSHNLAVLSDAPESKKEESAEKAESQTQFECPVKVEDRWRLFEFKSRDQFLINPSDPIVTSILIHNIKIIKKQYLIK